MDVVLSILLGIGLSAACGFRLFVPLCVVSIASYSGHLTLGESFQWMGTVPALIAFGVATVIEIAGYYLPWVDNLLDSVAVPAAVVAGTVVTASVVTDISPLLRYTLALIAGGGAAVTVKGMMAVLRAGSSLTTGGLANPLVSTGEAIGAVLLSVLAVLLPLVAGILAIGLVLLAARLIRKWRERRKAEAT